MKDKRSSKTAESVAACRAWHTLYGDPKIFDDPFAIQLTSIGWRTIAKSRFLTMFVVNRVMKPLRPVFATILGRARYAEDALDRAVESGVDQYVLLSAGLDSFALRRVDLAPVLKVFELDHPASQASKRKRLEKLNIDQPANLEFVPIDFEKENLARGLIRSSYSSGRPAFFSWMGATAYLTNDAVIKTLESIAAAAAPGSELVFDYIIPKELLGPEEESSAKVVYRYVARRGEPFKSGFDPQAFPKEIGAMGFEVLEQLTPNQIQDRYLADAEGFPRRAQNMRLAHCRLRA
jgi:methyltransferase (TIGR00027 family)